MKDIYIPKKVPRIEVKEKLHGHTQILLRNERTGRVERIEHNNSFTDGIESYCRDLGVFLNSPFASSSVRGVDLWQTLLGGILLFDTALPTSPQVRYMPAGTTMVANASYGTANASAVTELGSYNEVESVTGDNSLSLVFDWGTSQGNGTIASVALTTQLGGYIGYGNATSGQSMSSIKVLNDGQSNLYWNGTDSMKKNMTSMLFHDNKLYKPYSISSTELVIKVFNAPIDEVDIFRGCLTNGTEYTPVTVSLPNLSENYEWTDGGKCANCFFLVPMNNKSAGASITIYKVDVTDGSLATYTFTNNTTKTVYSQGALGYEILDDTYVVLACTDGTFYKVNYTNGTVVGQITGAYHNGSTSYQGNTWAGSLFADDLFVIGLPPATSGGSFTTRIYDSVLNKCTPTNAALRGQIGGNGAVTYVYSPEYDALIFTTMYNVQLNQYSMFKNPLRLMTINNLDSPVTKTADKTMKVTYTITRAS